jgi:mRNA-degrading endonuclease RelE of RelBE toxin-antitoxin system
VNVKWTIIDQIKPEVIKRLPNQEKHDLEEIKKHLENDPFNEDFSKSLTKPLEDTRQSYLGKTSYRLCFKVSLDTHKVFLRYVGPRSSIRDFFRQNP